MNERIEQLWEEAAKTTQGDSWEEQTKFMEKFAELIVGECIKILADNSEFRGCVIIGKHFKVEE